MVFIGKDQCLSQNMVFCQKQISTQMIQEELLNILLHSCSQISNNLDSQNLNKQMDQSRFISQFTTNRFQKNTPSTISPSTNDVHHCLFCKQHLGKVSELRKRQIFLQLKNEQLKQLVNKLQREKQELIQQKVLTYDEYIKRQDLSSFSNKQDLQAELFEAKTMLQLLILSKSSSQVTANPIQFETLKQKCSNALLQNLRLQEKIMVRDRIIEERGFFPIYHYDRRVITLRKSVAYWYKKAQEECNAMKNRCKNLKLKLNQEVQSMRNAMNEQIEIFRSQFIAIKQNVQNPIKKTSKEQKDKKVKASKKETGARSLVLKMR